MMILLGLALCPAPSPGASLSSLNVMVAGGQRYFYIKDLATFYGYTLRVPPGRKIFLDGRWSSVAFEVDSRAIKINGTTLWLNAPVTKIRDRWVVTETDVRKVVDPILRPTAYLGSRGYRVVVLDPGHGEMDIGAKGRRGVVEKLAVLDIAKRVRVYLANTGLKVYLTRETDRFIELQDRSWRAARWGADLFVSIHINSSVSPASSGREVYVLTAAGYLSTAASPGVRVDKSACVGNRFDSANAVLGYYIQKALLEKAGGVDRGLRHARFVVLKESPCPAALVECGFVSDRVEEARLLTPAHREAVALGIAKGILDYLGAVKRAHVVTP